MPNNLAAILDSVANAAEFSGVVSVRLRGQAYQNAFGQRDRVNGIPNDLDTRFGIASGTKGFTAVGVARLIEANALGFDTTARSILGNRISNLHPDITIRHLLGHTSGIGDYLDESEIENWDEFVLPIPVQDLVSPLDYIPLFEAKPQKFTPSERFAYSNGGYVLLAMIIELVSAMPYQDFIETQVFAHAGMKRSGFYRTDTLPENTAIGYLASHGPHSNENHLPVRGGGDGGAYTTIADMDRFWWALKQGKLLPLGTVALLLEPRNSCSRNRSYGYGFYREDGTDQVMLVGQDVGVCFHSRFDWANHDGFTVISNAPTNASSGAWPVIRHLGELFKTSP